MKSILFSLFVIFASTQAMASIAGTWTGWGQWAFRNEADFTKCETMQMTWSETDVALILEKGYYDCGMVGMELYRTEWTKKDGKLFDENQVEIGTYDGKNLDIKIASPAENTDITISLKREANHFDYREVWFNKYEKVYIIQGRLFTSGN